jgi:signal transduction histidine kinase
MELALPLLAAIAADANPPIAYSTTGSSPCTRARCRRSLAPVPFRPRVEGVLPLATPDLLERIGASTGGLFGDAFVRRLLDALPRELGAPAAFVAEVTEGGRLHLLTYYPARDEWHALEEDAEPLTDLLGDDPLLNAAALRDRYPEDFFADDDGIAAAHAVTLLTAGGSHLGHLGVLDAVPGCSSDLVTEVLELVAGRAALELERRRADSELQAAVDEQAALRRIATFVASGIPPATLRDALTYEVAWLFQAQSANIARFEDGERIRVVGVWAEEGASTIESGAVMLLDGETATAKVKRTNAPARVDSYEHLDGLFAAELRAHGINGAISAPIVVDGRLWGAITASKSSTKTFPPDAELRLGKFAQLFALAIANAEAREQLAASRARLVEEALAERRRLERNLHDGAQQRLVALSLLLRLVHGRAEGEVKQLLEEASAELATALAELRELARGIHPAVLTDRGLVAAIDSLVGRAPLPVSLEAEVTVRPSPAVEAAAYYVVAESLTNVAKYAEATTATVRATSAGALLVVEVEDDGIGGADAARGSGLAGLADRAAALGGRLEVRSPPGAGTLVRVEIPSRR